MRLKRRRAGFWIGAALLFVPLVYVTYLFASITLPYRDAESILRKEAASIALPANFTLTKTVFHSGHCLDDCPEIKLNYTIADTNRLAAYRTVQQLLLAKQYALKENGGDPHAGELYMRRDKFALNAHLSPQARPFAGAREEIAAFANPDNDPAAKDPVNALTIDIEYQP